MRLTISLSRVLSGVGPRRRLLLASLLSLGMIGIASGQSTQPGDGPAPTPAATQPASDDRSGRGDTADAQARLSAMVDKMPGVKVDLKNKRVEVEAEVATTDAKWLELLACTKGTREYEAIIAVNARPSHIHLGLLLIGLENGAPMKWESTDGQPVKVTVARGPKVRVTLRYEKDGKTVSVPASQWVLDRTTGKPIQGDTWVFAGSRVGSEAGQPIYYADASGSVITLVNFGDDLLAREVALGNKDGNDHFAVNGPLVPEKGTKLTVVLEPAVEPREAGGAEDRASGDAGKAGPAKSGGVTGADR